MDKTNTQLHTFINKYYMHIVTALILTACALALVPATVLALALISILGTETIPVFVAIGIGLILLPIIAYYNAQKHK